MICFCWTTKCIKPLISCLLITAQYVVAGVFWVFKTFEMRESITVINWMWRNWFLVRPIALTTGLFKTFADEVNCAYCSQRSNCRGMVGVDSLFGNAECWPLQRSNNKGTRGSGVRPTLDWLVTDLILFLQKLSTSWVSAPPNPPDQGLYHWTPWGLQSPKLNVLIFYTIRALLVYSLCTAALYRDLNKQ